MHLRKSVALFLLSVSACLAAQAQTTEILTSNGDGTHGYVGGAGLAIDSLGNVYAAGLSNSNVFKITPGGAITQIMDASGDGTHALDRAQGLAVDSSDNVYVTGQFSNNVFRIADPGAGNCNTGGSPCAITQIMDASGDGNGNTLDTPLAVVADAGGNIYVGGGFGSDNVFKINTPGSCSTGGTPCTITQIMDASGDGSHTLSQVGALGIDNAGDVLVVGYASDNVFRIDTPTSCSTGGTPCAISQIIGSDGDGGGNILDFPRFVAVDGAGSVYVTGYFSDNVFQITSGGTITEIAPASRPIGLGIDNGGNLFVAESTANVVTRIAALASPSTCSTGGSACPSTTVIDATGDGGTGTMSAPGTIAVRDAAVVVNAFTTDNVLKAIQISVIFADGFDGAP